jgi:hypothetical protein
MLLEDKRAFRYNVNELFRALRHGWGKDIVKTIIWMGSSAPVPWKQVRKIGVVEHDYCLLLWLLNQSLLT